MPARPLQELTRAAAPYFLLAVALSGALLCACITGEGAAESMESAGDRNGFAFREGKRLYEHYCSPCHGMDGKGHGRYFVTSIGPPLPDFTDITTEGNGPDALATEALKENQTGCLPWGASFNDTEMEYLVEYIRRFAEDEAPQVGETEPTRETSE